MSTACASLLRVMAGLPEIAMRRAVVTERLSALPPEEAAAVLDELLHRAAAGSRGAQNALLGWALFRMHAIDESAAVARRIREAALTSGQSLVAALLAEGPPHKSLARLGRLAEVCISARTQLDFGPFPRPCMGPHYYRIERLLRHPDPILIGRLLKKRYIDVRAVLLIAARRPTSAAIVHEITSHERWMCRVEVREALAANPFAPVEVALSLLPTLRQRTLRELCASGDVRIGDAAGRLLALRT